MSSFCNKKYYNLKVKCGYYFQSLAKIVDRLKAENLKKLVLHRQEHILNPAVSVANSLRPLFAGLIILFPHQMHTLNPQRCCTNYLKMCTF